MKAYIYVSFWEFYSFSSYTEIFDSFWVKFLYDVRQGSNFILSYVDIHLSQHHLLKGLSFHHWIILAPKSKSIDYKCKDLFLVSILFHWDICLSLCLYHSLNCCCFVVTLWILWIMLLWRFMYKFCSKFWNP